VFKRLKCIEIEMHFVIKKEQRICRLDKSFARGIGNRDYMIEVFQGDNH